MTPKRIPMPFVPWTKFRPERLKNIYKAAMKKRPRTTISLVFINFSGWNFVRGFLKNFKAIWLFRSEFGKKNALILPLFKFDRACRGGHGDIISRLLELKKQLEVDLDNRLGTIHILHKQFFDPTYLPLSLFLLRNLI